VLVGNGCNGAWAHLIFLASVLAYPATWKEKLLGLAVGQPVLVVLNVVRVVSLFIIGLYAPTIFRAAHVYVWQFLIIGFAMLMLFIWADQFVRRPA
jgi:exosortase/archaeosortase family protein